jgi:hypothetical protein
VQVRLGVREWVQVRRGGPSRVTKACHEQSVGRGLAERCVSLACGQPFEKQRGARVWLYV